MIRGGKDKERDNVTGRRDDSFICYLRYFSFSCNRTDLREDESLYGVFEVEVTPRRGCTRAALFMLE